MRASELVRKLQEIMEDFHTDPEVLTEDSNYGDTRSADVRLERRPRGTDAVIIEIEENQ